MLNILHIDMDAFFASVEIAEQPELVNKPVVVTGHIGERSVVSAANYVARQYGVFSAMSLKIAQQKCRSLVIITADFSKYNYISGQVRRIIEHYTPEIEQASIDEFYIDVKNSHLLFGPSEQIALNIKKEIRIKFNLTCSIGLSYNKLLAKIGSGLNKPDGFTVISPENFEQVMDQMNINKIPGIGPKTAALLYKKNIQTIYELRQMDLIRLGKLFGINALYLYNSARGIGDDQLTLESEIKSISHETTFSFDTADINIIQKTLLDLSDKVAARLREDGLRGRTIRIKVKYYDFKLVSRQSSFNDYISSSEEIYQNAVELIKDLNYKPIRLVGVGVTGLTDDSEQLMIFSGSTENTGKKVDKNIDVINKKFGKGVIKRARLL